MSGWRMLLGCESIMRVLDTVKIGAWASLQVFFRDDFTVIEVLFAFLDGRLIVPMAVAATVMGAGTRSPSTVLPCSRGMRS